MISTLLLAGALMGFTAESGVRQRLRAVAP